MSTTPRPDWASAYPTYEDMVQSWGAVHEFITCGSYQGDHVLLLTDDAGRFGFSVIGYGSCSGCDALESAAPWSAEDDWQPVVDLASDLRGEVEWFDRADDLAAYVARRFESGNDWWAYDDEVKEAVRKCVETALRLEAQP